MKTPSSNDSHIEEIGEDVSPQFFVSKLRTVVAQETIEEIDTSHVLVVAMNEVWNGNSHSFVVRSTPAAPIVQRQRRDGYRSSGRLSLHRLRI